MEVKMRKDLMDRTEEFRAKYPVAGEVMGRVQEPSMPFYGTGLLERAVAALLEGENLLLCGDKATGKNVLAENLAWIFGRPLYNISFHVNTDSNSLIGTDTFVDNQVTLRKGPVYQCGIYGGFGVLDEINMAKNEAVSVLHAALDFRRVLDVPGYERIELHPAARFIATMNYGYAGTKELNEALVSRFMVINMPPLTMERLEQILRNVFPAIRSQALDQFAGLFLDLQLKAKNGEISTKAVDMRGLMGALRLIRGGISPVEAIDMGITNKCFDLFERELIEDMVMTRIPESWNGGDVFEDK
ncbi:MAG TPA: MoxR family ATPase [Candidatus Blautia pullicola]|jgi:nitric oxide reductase NorQ protein|uniref:MoxR family ATPase n=1 Tax=Candidatus Blautia pullicola TaxID=2838498 RepID=A0A9D2FR03_9FIRM|nr:MoxR family ATPase [Candidatus Blautia pullicola]